MECQSLGVQFSVKQNWSGLGVAINPHGLPVRIYAPSTVPPARVR